jgi:hypothetical protein
MEPAGDEGLNEMLRLTSEIAAGTLALRHKTNPATAMLPKFNVIIFPP